MPLRSWEDLSYLLKFIFFCVLFHALIYSSFTHIHTRRFQLFFSACSIFSPLKTCTYTPGFLFRCMFCACLFKQKWRKRDIFNRLINAAEDFTRLKHFFKPFQKAFSWAVEKKRRGSQEKRSFGGREEGEERGGRQEERRITAAVSCYQNSQRALETCLGSIY